MTDLKARNQFLANLTKGDTFTQNGAVSNSSTGSRLTDQFAKAGTFRGRELNEVFADQSALWGENPEMALRLPFYLHSMIADIVYACTNEKGKNRDERANDKYYEGIRTTSYAPFIKLCDRLANVRYSTLFDVNSKMAKVYKKEHEHFINQLTCLQSNPYISIMEEEMKVLLKDTEL